MIIRIRVDEIAVWLLRGLGRHISAKLARRCGWDALGVSRAHVNAPVQYGSQVKAAAIYLSAQHLIPEDRLAGAMGDLFGADCCVRLASSPGAPRKPES